MRHLKVIGNILVAALLIVSTMGVTINKHYCMGELKDTSLYHHAETCVSEMKYAPEGFAMDCCEDTSEEYKVDEFNNFTQNLDFKADFSQIAVITYLLIDSSILEESDQDSEYLSYRPPLIDHDIPVMIQSFLL